jgi:hypothetical protein
MGSGRLSSQAKTPLGMAELYSGVHGDAQFRLSLAGKAKSDRLEDGRLLVCRPELQTQPRQA